MAGGEDEPQKVVVERVIRRGRQVLLISRRAQFRIAPELLGLALVDLRTPQPVNAAMLGGGHEPGARVLRDARLGPLLQRGDEGLLGKVLGERDVAYRAGNARDQPRGLDPPHGFDRARDVLARHGSGYAPASVWARSRSSLSRSSGVNSSPKSSDSNTGRISTTPCSPVGLGIRLTHSTASSIDLTCHSQ